LTKIDAKITAHHSKNRKCQLFTNAYDEKGIFTQSLILAFDSLCKLKLLMFKSLGLIFLLLPIFTFAQSPSEPNPKRLYLGNDTHVDLMFNGTEEKWAQLILEMADFYLRLGESTIKEEPANRSKWNYDCAYWMWVLENRTSPEYVKRIVAQIKNQQASIPYNFTLPIYGASTPEAILRSFYYSGYLERKYGIDVDLAVYQENATIPLGLASLWAGAGAKYSWKGVCNCATKTKTLGLRKNEIYWYTGLDSSRILMKWYSNFGWNAELGGYAEMLEPSLAVMQMDSLCGTPRYPYRIAGAFGKGWDNMVNYSYDLQWGIRRRTRPGTKVFISNELDFFKDFEGTYGQNLPSETLAYGNEWDLLPATFTNVSSGIRRSMEKLRGAEAMAAIVDAYQKDHYSALNPLKKEFLYALSIISAHGWTIDGPVTKDEFKPWGRLQERRVRRYVDTLQELAAKDLGALIQPLKQAGQQFFVFNPLNWVRSEVVDLPLDENPNQVVRDPQSKLILPSQVVVKKGQSYLRFLAENLPSVGYKSYLLEPAKGTTKTGKSPFTWANQRLNTPFWAIEVAKNGVITSLVEKSSGKEWVKSSNGKYLNDLGAGPDNSGLELSIGNQGPLSLTLSAEGKTPLRYRTRITVYRHSPRIDFDNEVRQNFNDPVYWTYSFNVDNPQVRHEEIGAVIRAATQPNGGHYATQNARYDHLSANHFVSVADGKAGMTLSNADCLFFKLGASKPDFLDEKSAQINLLVGGQIDKEYRLGIVNQAGDSLFFQRMALQPHTGLFDQAAAMSAALAHQNPPIVGLVRCPIRFCKARTKTPCSGP
jgi:alpha-mannosidase